MKTLLLITSLLIVCNAMKDLQFLTEFLNDKNMKVGLITCWTSEKIIKLMHTVQGPKGISKYKDNIEIANDIYVIIDVDDCDIAWNSLQELEEIDGYRYPLKLLILANNENKLMLTEKISKYSILIDTDIIIAVRDKDGNNYILTQPYKIIQESPLIWENYGIWKKESGLQENLRNVPIAIRRRNLQNYKFEIAMLLEDENSLNHLEDFRYPWTDVYTKQNYGPLMRLFEYLNASFTIKRVTSYSHLYEKNEFLLTGSAPYITSDLIPKITYAYLQRASRLCFLLKEPPTSYVTTIFTNAFTQYVWFATLATLVLLSVSYYIFLNFEAQIQPIKNQEKFNVFDLALIALEAVCQQGTSTDPRSYSARILAVIMFCAFMFLYVSYSANILVLLQSTTKIKSESYLKPFRIGYAGMETDSMLQYHSNVGIKLFGENVNASTLYPVTEGMEKVKAALFAFFLEANYGYKYVTETFTDYEMCGLQELACRFDMNLGYIALKKRSPYKKLIKIGLLQVLEYGFRNRHYDRYFLKPQCYNKGSSFEAVGIRETYQIMYLVVIGIVFSVFVFAGEKLLFKHKNRTNLM